MSSAVNLKNIAEKLIEHGIRVEHVKDSFRGVAEVFVVDSLKHSERKFQGHNEARLFGHYETRDVEIEGSYYYVSTRQPKVNLIFYLLEPESDDGFVNWNFFDDFLIREINENGTAIFPVFKIF